MGHRKVNSRTFALADGTSLPSGTDLNTITTIGNYYTWENATVLVNAPYSPVSCVLKVQGSAGKESAWYVRQTLRPHNSALLYTRVSFPETDYSGLKWSNWYCYQVELKYKTVTINNVTINTQGWVSIESSFPTGMNNFKFAECRTFGSSTKKVAFGVTGDGRYVLGTAGDVITYITVRYWYTD